MALASLFANNRLVAIMSFFAYTSMNLIFLFSAEPTPIDPVFFSVAILSALSVYVALSAHSRDQVLSHQKKKGSYHLLLWSLVIAFFFGHWLLVLQVDRPAANLEGGFSLGSGGAEVFMLIAVVVLWLVGRKLYDKP